jgi:toxin FitB
VTRPVRYLLDTSAVIDLPAPDRIQPASEYLISSITVAELNAGIHTTDDPVERARRLARLHWVADTFDPLPFTVPAAHMYGQIVALVIAAGRNHRRRGMDLLIAAVAAIHQLPLVTRNPADFGGLESLLVLVGIDKD